MRVRTAALLALAVLLVDLPSAGAAQSSLDRARSEANEAASDLARAQSRLSVVQGEIADLERAQAENRRRLGSLEGAVRDVAVAQYMRGAASGTPTVVDPGDVTATTRAAALASIVAAGSDDTIDAYRAAAEDHALAADRLSAAREAARGALADYRDRLRAARSQLARLQRLEAERLARTRVRSQTATPARSARRTGSVIIGSGRWICPVQGPRAFTNDWGDPRGGGRRRHQGTDILAPRGTPVVAPVSGSARIHNSSLGGKSFYLRGSDGNTYFGTHLDSYSGNTGSVAAGTVLGYVGDSGNARGGPTHLHFEIHPGGGGPVNPYPTLRQYC